MKDICEGNDLNNEPIKLALISLDFSGDTIYDNYDETKLGIYAGRIQATGPASMFAALIRIPIVRFA